MNKLLSILLLVFSFEVFSATENFMVTLRILEGVTLTKSVLKEGSVKFEVTEKTNSNVTYDLSAGRAPASGRQTSVQGSNGATVTTIVTDGGVKTFTVVNH